MFGLSPIVSALGIALALSLLGNAALGNWWLEARDERVQAVADRDSARGAAQQCSDGVASLQAAAERRASEAEQARDAAEAVSQAAQRRAQALLTKRPSMPADDCRSAAVQMDEWLTNRGAK